VSNLIGGASNYAEVARLYAKGFKGARQLFPAASNNSSIKAVAAYDAPNSMFYIMTENTSASTITVSTNTSLIGAVAPYVMIESVSPQRRGSASIQQISNGVVTYAQPGRSVVLVSVAKAGSLAIYNYQNSVDATVKGGANGQTNYGTSPNLYAAGWTADPGGRNVTFIRFDNLNPSYLASLKYATLTVFGQAKTTGNVIGTEAIAHVYGISSDNWAETTIVGSNAPNLAFNSGTSTRITDNFVTDVGGSAEFLGHLTGTATAELTGLDVTRWLKRQTDGKATFMIIREVRFDPSNASLGLQDKLDDDNHRSLWMASRDNPTVSRRPVLTLVK
jgi:hypothetical protein